MEGQVVIVIETHKACLDVKAVGAREMKVTKVHASVVRGVRYYLKPIGFTFNSLRKIPSEMSDSRVAVWRGGIVMLCAMERFFF